jgi:uncharacterized protein (DUF849 family)
MIVQACINGAPPSDFHLALPLTGDAMACDSAACIAAGAAEPLWSLHFFEQIYVNTT